MRMLARLYPKGDSVDRATAVFADLVFLAVLAAGALYWWHSAQPKEESLALPESGWDALTQVETSPPDGSEHLTSGQPIPIPRHLEPEAVHKGATEP